MPRDGENYSFFGHNLPGRSTNPQQNRQMNGPRKMVVTQTSSDKALEKLATISILSQGHDKPMEAGASNSGVIVHIPHPPSPNSSSTSNVAGSHRSVNTKNYLKRTRLESPKTSGCEVEYRQPKHLFNSQIKPPSALPPLEMTPINRRRESIDSCGSVDSVNSAASSNSTENESPRRHRNLRGVEPLKEIKSDMVSSSESYQRDGTVWREEDKKETGHFDVCASSSTDKPFADTAVSASEEEKNIWHSTPYKSQERELSLVEQTESDNEDIGGDDSDESFTSVSTSNDSANSDSDCESDSGSGSQTHVRTDQVVKSLRNKRNPNSTLPSLPLHNKDTFESCTYETVNNSQNEINRTDTITSSHSGTYESVVVYQDSKAGLPSKELHHSSTSDLTKLENNKKKKEASHLKGHYSSDTDLSVVSAGSSQVSGVSQTSFLPKVFANSVRNRNKNFLKEEMEKYLPDRRLGVFAATWNMHEEKEIPYCLDDLLLPPNVDYLQDIYAVGAQESTSSRKELEIKLQEALGPSHVLMHSCSFGVLHLAIFIRRELVWFCSEASQASIATRIGHQFKTKGALAVTFRLFGTSFLFINSHFTSDEGKAQDRINDYLTISKSLSLPAAGQDEDITNKFDRVFWLGDFNFRVEMEREKVIEMIEKYKEEIEPNYKELLEKDQMADLMDKGKVFIGFKEAPVKFLPSYKHDLQSDNYDSSSKMRTPSWTDRVIYKSQDEDCIKPVCYNSCATVKTSDHRPVFGIFDVTLNCCEENIPLTGGQYLREVYIEANRRRAAGPKHQDQSTVCTIF